jgi:crotonobetainyl-CoA:carnitine CoA-transferase CaiB-like acyl-CoA transferase
VALSGSTPQVAKRIFEVIGRPEMIDDPRFKTNSDRVKHRDLVDAAVGEWFAGHGHDEALSIMREAGATVGPIYSIADIAADEHFSGRGIIVDVEDKQFGSLPVHNVVPRLSETPGTFRRPAPELGEHTAEVLKEAGVDPATVLG